MPELPEVTLYVRALEARLLGRTLERADLRSAFFVRTAAPPLSAAYGGTISRVFRAGKRICIRTQVASETFTLAVHLMTSGRLHWHSAGRGLPGGKAALASFRFDVGSLLVTEPAAAKRASLHVLADESALDQGGIEPLTATFPTFCAALARENRTLKRALTDPRIVSGIGQVYSDEILHRAKLSPFKLTWNLSQDEARALHAATASVLTEWISRLEAQADGEFPEMGTTFRSGMAVHGRYNLPCPDCGTAVQRITYAGSECAYCAVCQTGGKLLADRGLSRLLKSDWPRSLEALERMKSAASAVIRGSSDDTAEAKGGCPSAPDRDVDVTPR
jgi:formamidopyrimidine-DNA glycosylase